MAYEIENNGWVLDKSVSNLPSNLCLHLGGNLNHFKELVTYEYFLTPLTHPIWNHLI